MPAVPSLQQVAGSAGMLFGAAVNHQAVGQDASYRELLTRECGIVSPELALWWRFLEPRKGQVDFTSADAIASFAMATGKTMHGHALLWHQGMPDWLTEELATEPDWRSVRRFLSSLLPRYGEVTTTWDVINEAIEPGERDDGLRPSPFLRAFGPGYIRRAFEEARTFAPQARLFLNEYGLDYAYPVEEARRNAALKLLEKLKKEGAPIDGFGMQAHLDLSKQDYFDPKVLADFLNELGAMGLEIRISELDVKEADRSLPVKRRDALATDAVRRYLDVALANRAVGTVCCWGISDRYSWLNEGDTVNRGLPFDATLRPKAMHTVLLDAFRQRRDP